MNPTATPAVSMIVPDSLLTYIRTEVGRGVSGQALRQALAAQNWQTETVEAAFLQATGQTADQAVHVEPVVQTDVVAEPVVAVQAVSAEAIANPDPLGVVQQQTTTVTTELKNGHKKVTITHLVTSETLLGSVFRAGFSFIFIINGIIALVRPADFTKLLSGFPLAVMLGHIPQMVMFTAVHDTILGLLILSGKWRKYVWAWAGIWLSLVTIIKLVGLL